MTPAPTPSRPSRKQRAGKACVSCRSRKIRCDLAAQEPPCSNCRSSGFDCYTIARKKRVSSVRSAKSQSGERHGSDHQRNTFLQRQEIRSQVEITATLTAGGSEDGTTQESRQIAHSSPARVRQALPTFLEQHRALHSVPHYSFLSNIFVPSEQGKTRLEDIILRLGNGPDGRPVQPNSTCNEPEIRYLEEIGAFDLPTHAILNDFVATYFHAFHPFFPILEKSPFLSSLQEMISGHGSGPKILLLQAVLFIASGIVSSELLQAAGFQDRKQARHNFYLKARRLYDMDYEDDHITIIQTLLLISQYYPSITERKHTWHWIHQAISLAQASGLYRDPGNVPCRKLWARIWWACVVRDRCNGLGTGRPLLINSLDCNVNVLTVDDLLEEGDTSQDVAVKTMFIEFTKLCQCIEAVLTLQYTTSTSDRAGSEQFKICEQSLQNWEHSLPVEARRCENVSFTTQNNDISTLYRAILHAGFNTLKISLFQAHILWNLPKEQAENYRQQVQLAAIDNTQLFSQLINFGLVKFCPTIAVTFTLSPLVVHVLGIRSSEDLELRQTHRSRFDLCMMFLLQLGKVYWHAIFYSEFFQLAASIAQEETPRSPDPGDSLASFLYQPISLGHLMILQQYQDNRLTDSSHEMANSLAHTTDRPSARAASTLSLHDPTDLSQTTQQGTIENQMSEDSFSQLPGVERNFSDLDSHETSSNHPQPLGDTTMNINEWLGLYWNGGKVVPFA